MKTAKQVQKEMNMIIEGLGNLWMDNYKKQGYTKFHTMHSLYNAISDTIGWYQTKQGWEFWSDMSLFFYDLREEGAI